MKVHFIAMGGSIMHSLAIALDQAGYVVSGSDDQIYNPAYTKLKDAGLLPEKEGWHPERITPDLDAVILGMHAFDDNPELNRAKELGLNIVSFPEFIFQQSRNKHRIVVAGSYGKTTVTSMIMHVLKGLGRKFDYMVGAEVPGFDNPVRITPDAPLIVMEGDEYLASKLDPRPKFLLYQPHIAVITGISWDHINVFPTEKEYNFQFARLLQSLEKAADIVYNQEDKLLSGLVKEYVDESSQYPHPFGVPSYKVKDGVYEVKIEGEKAAVKMIGKHNMANIAAAWEVCNLLSVEPAGFMKHIATFTGAALRMQTVVEDSQKLVIKDYAHAPAKVQATVEAVREKFKKRNLIACVELHTFSSLNKNYLPLYKNTLKKADHKIVYVDPHALEKRRMPAISQSDLTDAFAEKNLVYVTNPEELRQAIKKTVSGDDVMLMMSSGNFGGMDLSQLG
ncbi:MAG: Mur ligase family protein [Bacteroidia bacterium]|nr:Mur ligase family protein [Bacteroidia bacterium]